MLHICLKEKKTNFFCGYGFNILEKKEREKAERRERGKEGGRKKEGKKGRSRLNCPIDKGLGAGDQGR